MEKKDKKLWLVSHLFSHCICVPIRLLRNLGGDTCLINLLRELHKQ